MKRYCPDCKAEVDVQMYNEDADPPLVTCVECGQFCYERGSTKRAMLPKTINIPAGSVVVETTKWGLELYNDNYYTLTIKIGNNHTARLIIDEDALRALTTLIPGVSIY